MKSICPEETQIFQMRLIQKNFQKLTSNNPKTISHKKLKLTEPKLLHLQTENDYKTYKKLQILQI
jgi:hypothetical protein